jgi:diaminopimelate epimerase
MAEQQKLLAFLSQTVLCRGNAARIRFWQALSCSRVIWLSPERNVRLTIACAGAAHASFASLHQCSVRPGDVGR